MQLLFMQAIFHDVYRYCDPLKHLAPRIQLIHYCSYTYVTHICNTNTNKVCEQQPSSE